MSTSKATVSEKMTENVGGADGSKASEVFAAHIKDVLAAGFDRRKTLEASGAATIHYQCLDAALVVAVIALLIGKDFVLQNVSAGRLLIGALGAFVVANVLAIFVQNYSIAHTVKAREPLEGMVC